MTRYLDVGDRQARAAAAWTGRASSYAYAHPLRNRSRSP